MHCSSALQVLDVIYVIDSELAQLLSTTNCTNVTATATATETVRARYRDNTIQLQFRANLRLFHF